MPYVGPLNRQIYVLDENGQVARVTNVDGTGADWTKLVNSIIAADTQVLAEAAAASLLQLTTSDVLLGPQHRSPKNGNPTELRVIDSTGAIAFMVDKNSVTVGDTKAIPSKGYRWIDKAGNISAEIDGATGDFIIYSPVFPNGLNAGSNTKVTRLHVFVVVGQSNISGPGLPTTPALDPADSRIFQFGSKVRTLRTATVPLDQNDSPGGLSPATVFAREYLKTQPANVGVLLIPAARGGTGFTNATDDYTWSKGVATNPIYGLYELSVKQTKDAIAAAVAAGYVTELKAVLWHQGENNSSFSTASMTARLTTLKNDYAVDLGMPNIPMVVGQMSLESIATVTGREGINKAHTDFPAVNTYAGFAQADPRTGATRAGDTTHFSRQGVEYIGKNYLGGYWQALANTGVSPGAPARVNAVLSAGKTRVSWEAPPRSVVPALQYDLDGGNVNTYTPTPSRITEYLLDASFDNGATWTPVVRNYPTYLSQEFTNSSVNAVRVRARNGSTDALSATTPVTTA